jgi:hypothetical protein
MRGDYVYANTGLREVQEVVEDVLFITELALCKDGSARQVCKAIAGKRCLYYSSSLLNPTT